MLALLAVAVMIAAALLDFAAARYTRSLVQSSERGRRALLDPRIHAAARWSVGMCLLSTVGLLALVNESPWMVVPECIGLYAGTVISGVLRSDDR